MKKYKLGFTLSEVLICIVIIGVIMALSVQTIKIARASYTSLAYFEYNDIKQISTELLAGDFANKQGLKQTIVRCLKPGHGIVTYLNPDKDVISYNNIQNCPNGAADIKGAQKFVFCEALTQLTNVVGTRNCSTFGSVSIRNGNEPYISNLNPDNPNFITSNGRRYYLSSWTKNNSISSELGFRVISVDLNGKSGPNTDDPNSKKPADIISFVIFDNGEVFPVGVAADNITLGDNRIVQYLNSKVNGYYYRATSTNDESGKPQKREGVPSDCFIVDRNGTAFTKDGRNYKQICDYAKVNVPNLHKDSSGKSAFFSYREAYCQALGPNKTSPFKDYCSGIEGNKLCPPSSDKQSFDSCVVENVRPAFRYNLK